MPLNKFFLCWTFKIRNPVHLFTNKSFLSANRLRSLKLWLLPLIIPMTITTTMVTMNKQLLTSLLLKNRRLLRYTKPMLSNPLLWRYVAEIRWLLYPKKMPPIWFHSLRIKKPLFWWRVRSHTTSLDVNCLIPSTNWKSSLKEKKIFRWLPTQKLGPLWQSLTMEKICVSNTVLKSTVRTFGRVLKLIVSIMSLLLWSGALKKIVNNTVSIPKI